MEERVQEIEEQLCKLDSDKCVVEVCFQPVCVCGGWEVQHMDECECIVSVSAGSSV